MRDGSKYPIGYSVYTYVYDNTGENIHIDVPRLRKWCLRKRPQKFMVQVDTNLAMEYVENNIVSNDRVKELLGRWRKNEKFDPIIIAKSGRSYGPDTYHVDGHHRYVVYAALEIPFIEGWVLPKESWKKYQIINIPTLSHEELRAQPILKRNY